MLAIGRGLASSPKLLMLDEPSMGLAPTIADFIFEKLLEIRRDTRLTMLLVEQRVAEALQSADHGYVLEAGRVVLEGNNESCAPTTGYARRISGCEEMSCRGLSPASSSPRRWSKQRDGRDKRRDEKNTKVRRKHMQKRSFLKLLAGGAMLPAAADAGRRTCAGAEPSEVKVGLIAPLSGIYARPGTVMNMGADMAIERINAQGGIKSLGGAKLKLVLLDSGDTTEKAKNAAQRMVAQETDLVAATGAYLSSFTLAVTEVTERAKLPMLTLSYSDLITSRGFKYVFQTSATAASQAEQSLPVLIEIAETATGQQAQDGRDRHGQHGRVRRLRQADEGAPAEGARPQAGGGRDLHAAAGGRDAAGPEGALGAARPAVLPADGHLRRQAAAGEDERVRPGPRQGADHLVRHRHRRAGHAAHHDARAAAGRDERGRQLGLQGS